MSAAALGSIAALCTCSLWASDAPKGVVEALEKKYVVTQTTTDFEQITKDGTTMAMKCAGVYSISTSLIVKPDNKVVEGKIETPGSMTRMLWAGAGAHVLQAGDKVFITKIDSKSESGGDLLRFTLLTVDALDVKGTDAKKKYDAIVSFKFKKGYLEETPPEQVEEAVESVLAPDAGDEKGQETAAAGPPSKAAGGQQVMANSAPAPAPEPAAPAGPPATITIGESSTEVLQAMGMPQQMIDLGKKKTYVYKNMKIIFMNDKVSDVQ